MLSAGPLGLDPAAFDAAGDGSPVNLEAMLDSGCGANTASFGTFSDTLYAILAKKMVCGAPPPAALAAVRAGQQANGGWNFTGDPTGTDVDTDTTAVAVEGLVAGGADATDPAVHKALGFFAANQQANGSWQSFGATTRTRPSQAILGDHRRPGYDVTSPCWRDVLNPAATGHSLRRPRRLVGVAATHQPAGRRRSHRQPERRVPAGEHVRDLAERRGAAAVVAPDRGRQRPTCVEPVVPVAPVTPVVPGAEIDRGRGRGRGGHGPARRSRGNPCRAFSTRVPGGRGVVRDHRDRARRRHRAGLQRARAVVVIDTGGGARTQTICFSGTISGLAALQIAGANPVTYGFAGQGAAVCALDGVGNPADSSCLTGPSGDYWAYYRAGPGATGWTYSRGGASSTTVTDGSVEGWRYGTGAAPGFVSFCAAAGCAPPPTAAPPPPTAAPVTTPPTSPPVGRWRPRRTDDARRQHREPGNGHHGHSHHHDDTREAARRWGPARRRRHQSGDPAVAGSSGGGAADPRWAWPIVVAVLAAVAGVGYWLRRRRRRAASAPTD